MSWISKNKDITSFLFWAVLIPTNIIVICLLWLVEPLHSDEYLYLLKNDSSSLDSIIENYSEISDLIDRVNELENNQNCIGGE